MDERTIVSISIVSHGQGDLILNLLSDFQRLQLNQIEIIITLNIPEPNTFSNIFPDLSLTVITNDTPKGFGANHNAAFKLAHGIYFCVVNPDIRILNFDILILLQAFQLEGIAACAPKVTDACGATEDSARKFPTISRIIKRVIFNDRAVDYSLDDNLVEVDWVAGMFIMFCRTAYFELGGFDERYFMYLEDADICKRLSTKGWKVVVEPRVSVVHSARRSSHHDLRHLKWHLISMFRYLTKDIFSIARWSR